MEEMNALARTVDRVWDDLESVKLTNALNRWWLVLDLIINNNGDNRLVELKSGKLFITPPEEAEIIKEALDTETMEADTIAAIDAAEEEELDTTGEELTHEFGWVFY
jgi:hypothetical protein